jgi:RNA-directed DNA polymerase
MRWVRNNYRRYRSRVAFHRAWTRVITHYPRFFAHWQWTTTVPAVW